MKRGTILLATVALALALFLSGSAKEAAYTAVEFKTGVVLSTAETVYTWTRPAPLVVISNDGTATVYVRVGQGTVDTTYGAGGGIVQAGETLEVPCQSTRLALKCASASSACRIWAYEGNTP